MKNLTEWAMLAEVKAELLQVADIIEKDREFDREQITHKLIVLSKMLHRMENLIFDG